MRVASADDNAPDPRWRFDSLESDETAGNVDEGNLIVEGCGLVDVNDFVKIARAV